MMVILKLKKIKDVYVEKVLVSYKISYSEKDYKYFLGYLCNDHKVKSLHIMLPEISAYVKTYDGQTKWIYFLFKDDVLLEKYKDVWDNVSANVKKEFDSESVYNKEFLKTKINSHVDEISDFYAKEIPMVDSNHTCLAVISLDPALKKGENFIGKCF